jgi:Xaa-Pro aminopeptidase
MMLREIPNEEYRMRVRTLQTLLAERGLDAYLVHGTEAEFGNVSYLSNHWPLFETCGVLVPREGEAVLLIGAEAEPFARSRSRLSKIRVLKEYREAAEPEYPHMAVSRFRDIFDEVGGVQRIKKLGLGDYQILPAPVLDGIREALGRDGELIRAEELITSLRTLKSENELMLMREAHHICERAFEDVLGVVKPGMTERAVAGELIAALYRNGADCEAYPPYVLSGEHTREAISRPTAKVVTRGEAIQFSYGARFGGYASSFARLVFFGRMPDEMRRLAQVCLDAHRMTYDAVREGVIARDVVRAFLAYLREKGFADHYVYSPCHGAGIIEVEKPWMEEDSTYVLRENMTFMADTFLLGPACGVRFEDGFRVTRTGVEEFSRAHQEMIEL